MKPLPQLVLPRPEKSSPGLPTAIECEFNDLLRITRRIQEAPPAGAYELWTQTKARGGPIESADVPESEWRENLTIFLAHLLRAQRQFAEGCDLTQIYLSLPPGRLLALFIKNVLVEVEVRRLLALVGEEHRLRSFSSYSPAAALKRLCKGELRWFREWRLRRNFVLPPAPEAIPGYCAPFSTFTNWLTAWEEFEAAFALMTPSSRAVRSAPIGETAPPSSKQVAPPRKELAPATSPKVPSPPSSKVAPKAEINIPELAFVTLPVPWLEGKEEAPGPLLSRSQAVVASLLERYWAARRDHGRDVPMSLLEKWSHPLLIGRSGSGKSFAAKEAARRLGLGYFRYDIGGWHFNWDTATPSLGILRAASQRFGSRLMIHLTGLETIAPNMIAGEGKNFSYQRAVAAEVTTFLDDAADRRSTDRPFVVVTGRFAQLWDGGEIGLSSDAWRGADKDSLTNLDAITQTLLNENHLSHSVSNRLILPPLVIRGIEPGEAVGLSRKVAEAISALPRALEGVGLSAEAAAEILRGPGGWRGLARRIEMQLYGWDLPEDELGPADGGESCPRSRI